MSEEYKKYWHEIPQQEVDDLIEKKVINQYVMDNYLQPKWCDYPDALAGTLGCWSLTDNLPNGFRTKISEDYCSTCECYKSTIIITDPSS